MATVRPARPAPTTMISCHYSKCRYLFTVHVDQPFVDEKVSPLFGNEETRR